MIIEETYNLLAERYGSEFEELVISDVRVGLHLTGVVLSDKSCGTSATISNNDPFRSKSNRDFGSFTPLMIKGRRVGDLFSEKKDSGLIATLRSAVLNAFSSKLFFSGKYPIIENCDPVQLLNFETPKIVTIIGAFQSYIRKIEPKCSKLNVLEFSESALDEKHRKYYVPAAEYKNVIPFSDIIIITGQTLVNGTIDELLKAAPESAEIIVSGPTVSIIPDILFKNKVTMIGAMRITNSEKMFDIVSQGGSGYHLFEYCAQKISILK